MLLQQHEEIARIKENTNVVSQNARPLTGLCVVSHNARRLTGL